MKQFSTVFFTFLLSLCISAVANAQIPMGAYTAEQTAYITAEDPTMTDGRNFKNLPVTMKKGEACNVLHAGYYISTANLYY
jgi:hypothetical protein